MPREDAITGALALIDATGGARQWLARAGMDATELAALSAHLRTPAQSTQQAGASRTATRSPGRVTDVDRRLGAP